MPSVCVIGVQWGDEGKGKIVDYLSRDADFVVRYQGGANAGHTVVRGGKKHVFHQIPSGILNRGTRCVIASGVVIDLPALVAEIDELRSQGVRVGSNLSVSSRAHLVMPYHKALDRASEEGNAGLKIGTTLRGIGPCYQDKVARTGIRVCDLMDAAAFRGRLEAVLKEKNLLLKRVYGLPPASARRIAEEYLRLVPRLRPFVAETIGLLNGAVQKGRYVLFEGAQGALLSVDFGTYPFVTSSNSDACGIMQGTGLPPHRIERIIGVAKVYQTRVGEGPFPSELSGELAEFVREKGGEYGATTGRPRRVGWFDLVSCRYSLLVNGINELALTKLDVLGGLREIQVCTAYRYRGRRLKEFPPEAHVLDRCRPECRKFRGFDGDVARARSWRELPRAARDYLRFLSDMLEVPIRLISVGNDRDHTFTV